MVAKLKELGIEVKYIEVPGGLHSDVVAPNLPAVIEFFDSSHEGAPRDSQRSEDSAAKLGPTPL